MRGGEIDKAPFAFHPSSESVLRSSVGLKVLLKLIVGPAKIVGR
jgi:hypothetical protein